MPVLEYSTFDDFIAELIEDKINIVRKIITFEQQDKYNAYYRIVYTAYVRDGIIYRYVEEINNEKEILTDNDLTVFQAKTKQKEEEQEQSLEKLGIILKIGLWSS